MTKYLLVFTFGALVFEPAAQAQFGIVSNFGAATGRKIQSQIDNSLRNGTRGFSTGASAKGKAGAPGTTAAAAAAKAAPANVPPPPPPPPQLQRKLTATKKTTVPNWMIEDAPKEPAPVKEPLNVDLAQVEQGMARESLLALGTPSSKMTLFDDGHLVEVYQYRNQTLASGTVRLRDGEVVKVEARP